MYFGGNSYGSPLNPVGALYFTFTQAGIRLGPYLGDTYHFYNSTFEQIADQMHATGNATLAQADSRKLVQILSYQIPALMMWWDAFNIPSLNTHSGNYWSGYVSVPAFGTWSYGTGYYTELNMHMVSPVTGDPITGGAAVVNMHEAPDDYNPLFAGSVYDFDVINSIFFDTPIVGPPGSPYISTMYPWMLTSLPQFGGPLDQLGVNMTTPHGYKMVDGQVIKLNFMDNITWQDNVPFTAADYNFSLWYEDLNGVYGPYTGNNNSNYIGEIPTLLDSTVQNRTSMTIYINSTSQTDWLYALTAPTLAEHLWSHVSGAQFRNDIDPTSPSNAVGGTLLMTGTDGFYWAKYVTGQYVVVDRFPGYFRTNIHAWQVPPVQAGNAEAVSFAMTQQGTPIPSSATVKATATLGGKQVASIPLTLGCKGNWTGSFTTTGWAGGFYEVTVNGTYTDTYGQSHTALEFYGMQVTAAPPPTTSTPPPTTSTPPPTTSTPPPTTSTPPPTTSTPPPTSSVSPAPNYTAYYIAAVVVVIIIIAGVAAYSRRKPS